MKGLGSRIVVLVLVWFVAVVILYVQHVAALRASAGSVTWTNQMQGTKYVNYARYVYMCGTNLTVELGMRSDGVVVWREVKSGVTLFGGECAKNVPLQKTYVVEYLMGTNCHRAVLTRDQYVHEFLLLPDYESGEPNAKLEVKGGLTK